MAITIHQQPALHSAIGSKTAFVASSTNSGNDGFKFVVRCNMPDGSQVELIVAANPNGRLIFEPNSIYYTILRNLPNSEAYDTTLSIHANTPATISSSEIYSGLLGISGAIEANFEIAEAWDVDSIFTINEPSVVTAQTNFYNAQLNLQSGLNYNYLQRIGYQDGLQSRIMSDRNLNTHLWDKANTFGLTSNCIYIPTYESDWGTWCAYSTTDASKIRLSILPASGPPVQQIHDLNIGGLYENVFIYPANLNASPISGILKPQDYPNWKAIYFQFLDDTDQIISATYVMYNAEAYANDGVGCLGVYDKIRLAWVGRSGGWEYHNFTKKSEESFVMETTTAQRPIGNYGQADGTTPFGFNSFDESEVVVDKKVDRFMTANSDWLTDGEFQWMKGLFLSKQVHWVQDDGTHIPVIVEGDGYVVKRKFGGGQLFDQQVKFRIAQPYFN